jgi:hypothetical protein
VFGGIRRRGIYDNMKTAIDKVGRGKERDVNVRFMAMASHYLFEPEFCNPASGWEKGQVEKNVQDARYRLWQSILRAPVVEAALLVSRKAALSAPLSPSPNRGHASAGGAKETALRKGVLVWRSTGGPCAE